MELDIYQQCPCHPDKKIKFCCGKEVISDLNRVLELHGSQQVQAALDALDRAVKKHGEQDCLLTAKVKILGALQQFPEAAAINEKFLAKNPQHYLGLEQRANLAAYQGNALGAFQALQDAMDHLPGAEIPVSFAATFRNVAIALLATGHPFSARMHAHVAMQLVDGPDEMALTIIHRSMSGSDDAPNLFQDVTIPLLPEGEFAYRKRYENVLRAVRRGQFRKGLEISLKALETAPHELSLVRLAAYSHAYLPNPTETKRAWQAYANHPDLTFEERLYAQSLWLFYAADDRDFRQFVGEYTCESLDRIEEHLLAQPNCTLLGQEDAKAQFAVQGIPPKHVFLALSNPAVAYDSQTPLSQFGVTECLLALYGRRTDSAPKISIYLNQDPESSAIIQKLKVVEPSLTAVPGVPVSQRSLDYLHWRINLPYYFTGFLTPADTRELRQRHQREFFENQFADQVWPGLGGQTFRQVMSNSETRPLGYALFAIAMLRFDNFDLLAEVTDKLSKQLGVDLTPAVVPQDFPPVNASPILAYFANAEQLTDQQLFESFQLSSGLGSQLLLTKFLLEMKRRDFHSDMFSKIDVIFMLAQTVTDDRAALDYFAQARTMAKEQRVAVNSILLGEFRHRLHRGIVDGTERLLSELINRSESDNELRTRLVQMFHELGWISPEGDLSIPRFSDAPATNDNALWTPDSEPQNTEAPSGSGASKLWIPGQ